MSSLETIFAHAVQRHRGGALAEAERLYREIVAVDPRHAPAWHLLGVVAHQTGRNGEAAGLIERAIEIDGTAASYHSNLGIVQYELGRFEDAAASHRAAIRMQPNLAEAHANLGNVLIRLGHLDEAMVACSTAIRLNPAFYEPYYNLANALQGRGRFEEAIAAYDAVLRIKPAFSEAHANRGAALRELGKLPEAVAGFRTAIATAPRLALAHSNLAVALRELGQLDEAVAACEAAIEIAPDFADAYSNLGMVLTELGRAEEAITAYRAAIRIRPDFAAANSNLVMSLHYLPDIDEAAILVETRRYASRLETGVSLPIFANVRDPDRHLRIGYVSGDLGFHPVGFFLSPVLAAHDREVQEVFCYSTYRRSDEMAVRLRAEADHWRSLVGLADVAAAEMVAADAIDILVDLSGHTAHNRLGLFARKPAPVQATWLGFWGTTGLEAMDYILSDGVTIRPDEEGLYSEAVLRLPGLRFCYGPSRDAPAPAPAPVLRTGAVTFGSFNNLWKIGAPVVERWAAVLHATPGSKLLLKWKTLANPVMRQRVAAAFARAGISGDRLELRGASPHAAMLTEYGEVDIALDPFPFSGGLTSCEALWMGVPVVTLPGSRAPSRQTAGFLRSIGLPELVAADQDDYIRIAVGLANDRQRLVALRQDLRASMARSPLCDGATFTRHLEAAYRTMWRSWCRSSDSSRPV